MSERRWVKILCGIYLLLYGIGTVVEVLKGHWNPALLIVPSLLLLLGMYVHGVEHMFDPKETRRKKGSI